MLALPLLTRASPSRASLIHLHRWLLHCDTLLGMNLAFNLCVLIPATPSSSPPSPSPHLPRPLLHQLLDSEVRPERSLKNIGPVLGTHVYAPHPRTPLPHPLQPAASTTLRTPTTLLSPSPPSPTASSPSIEAPMFTTSIVLIDGRKADLTYCPSAGGHNLHIDGKYQTIIPSCDLLLLGRLLINTACAIHECDHRPSIPGCAGSSTVPAPITAKPKTSDALKPPPHNDPKPAVPYTKEDGNFLPLDKPRMGKPRRRLK